MLENQATLQCGIGALACLLLLTIEILTAPGNAGESGTAAARDPALFAFVVLPLVLLATAVRDWWSVDHTLRRMYPCLDTPIIHL